MSNGSMLIEKLLSYASDNLYLSESDVYFKRLVLCQILRVTPAKESERTHTDCNLADLKKEVDKYIASNNLSDDVYYYSGLVFGCLMPLPSAIEKSFKLFREKMTALKAQQYFYGLMKAVGYIDEKTFSPLIERKNQPYLCCLEQIVYKDEKYAADQRYVTLNLIRDYLFGYEKNYDLIEQGNLIITDAKRYSLDEDALDDMFEFVDYMPEYYVSASRYSIGEKPDKLITFKEKLPAFSSAVRYYFRNDAYPDVEVGLTDWYISDLRFSGYNKNTLIRCINETANAWIEYKNEQIANGKTNKNYVQLVLKLMPDGRYVANMLLRMTDGGADKVRLDEKLSVKEINRYEFSKAYGKFVFTSDTAKLINKALSVITGKTRYEPTFLSSKDNELYPFSDVVSDIININGTIKETAKAEALLNDKIFDCAVSALKTCDPFNKDADGVLTLKMFLLGLDIKQI